MDSKTPQVFISYAHESPAFSHTVKELAKYLRSQTALLDTLPKLTIQQVTHGENSPIQNTGGGDAYYNSPDIDWEKVAKRPKNQPDISRKR